MQNRHSAKAIDELKLKEVGKEDKERMQALLKTGDSSTRFYLQ